MKCYNHPAAEAVGTCKHCHKGICAACAKDSGWGLVCSQSCEDEVRMVRATLERNRRLLTITAKSHLRNAIMLFAMAAAFIGYGMTLGSGSFRLYMIAFGGIALLGGGFAVFNSRRVAKL